MKQKKHKPPENYEYLLTGIWNPELIPREDVTYDETFLSQQVTASIRRHCALREDSQKLPNTT